MAERSTHSTAGVGYLHGLLQIQVPLKVTLAAKRLPVERVLELGPGSILAFDKSYQEPLTLEAADRAIARGEAVKVGEHFGIRILSMVLPAPRSG